MTIFFFCILNLIFVSYVRSDILPGVVCSCLGTHIEIDHSSNVKISDLPDRCKVVIIGEDFFNEDPSKEDNAAIVAAKAAGKIVYMMYGSTNKNWPNIVADPKKLEAFIEPMLKYLKKNNIEGLILDRDLMVHDGVIPDYAQKVNSLICIIKQSLPDIQIGLQINGGFTGRLKDKSIFDFTITNPTVNFYVVEFWPIGQSCAENLNAKGGRQPISSNDLDIVTLEVVCQDVTNSDIDKSKIVAYISDYATLLDPPSIKTYSEYCTRTGNGVWCADNSQILYDKVTYLKQNNFKGLMINYMDLDDMTNACGCDKFPVANIYIDAWEGKPLKKCAKLC